MHCLTTHNYLRSHKNKQLHNTDNVEMEIVLPGNMTVMESHDIALALQHKIESLEDVERAFVHVSVYSY